MTNNNIKTHNSLRKKLYIFRTIYNFTHGVTMDSLAKELGLNSSQNYYHLESGRKKHITLEQIEKLAEIYDTSTEFLLDNEKELRVESLYRESESIKVKDNSCSNKLIETLTELDTISQKHQDLVEEILNFVLNSRDKKQIISKDDIQYFDSAEIVKSNIG